MSGIASLEIETTCPQCWQTGILQVNPDAYIAWQGGKLIQNAFPEMSAGERERLLTGICPDCWTKLFQDEDEEE